MIYKKIINRHVETNEVGGAKQNKAVKYFFNMPKSVAW